VIMTKKLTDLVEIRSGYTFRVAIDTFPTGDTEVIQVGDIDIHSNVSAKTKIDFTGSPDHFLRYGDVLLSARGFSKAVVYRSDHKAVAASSLFVLRVKSQKTDPSFIAMFFNSIHGRKEMMRLSANSSVQTITKENLGQIGLPELPISEQNKLSRLIEAIDDYKSISQRKEVYLNEIRESAISNTFKETKL
jgi:restriction endonuclease S subunit